MKKQILFLLITVLSLNCYSQITFENGYYIDNTDQKINCLIKNIDWKNNPTEFEYKLSEGSESKKANLESVKEFGINDVSKYVRSIVNIDRSSEITNYLSNDKDPVFQEEELFLKVLIEGKFTLYEYVDQNLKRYFYNNDNSNIEQLIFKSYKTDNDKIGKNDRFKQQLWINLKCNNFDMSKIEGLDYKKNDLVNIFEEYNECNDQEFVNYTKKTKTDFFNLTLRPRLNSSSLKVQSFDTNSRDVDFDNKFGFGFGVEAEFILPFNKNKWAIAIEPTYQSFNSEKTVNVDNVTGGELIANVDYTSIEVPVSLRYYFFLEKNSKVFLNTSYIVDLKSESSIEYTRNDGSNIKTLEIYSGANLAFGIGYKHNDKYSLEARYQTNRELLGNYNSNWSAEYSTSLSVIFGYSLF